MISNNCQPTEHFIFYWCSSQMAVSLPQTPQTSNFISVSFTAAHKAYASTNKTKTVQTEMVLTSHPGADVPGIHMHALMRWFHSFFSSNFMEDADSFRLWGDLGRQIIHRDKKHPFRSVTNYGRARSKGARKQGFGFSLISDHWLKSVMPGDWIRSLGKNGYLKRRSMQVGLKC